MANHIYFVGRPVMSRLDYDILELGREVALALQQENIRKKKFRATVKKARAQPSFFPGRTRPI